MTLLFGLVLVLAAATPAADVERPESVVFRVYRDFACEAVLEQPDCRGLLEQPRSVLLRYFDDALAAGILADAADVEKTHESGRIDFLPLWDAQDPSGVAVRSIQPAGAGIVQVTLRFPDGSSRTLSFRLHRTKRGWRIADIQTPEWSLARLLGSEPD